MNRLRSRRARRIPALFACLALYIAGSNYCLLSAWGGGEGMACMSLPRAAAATAAKHCHHCAPTGDHARGGAPTAGRSCCPDPVVTPSSPSLDKDAAVAAVLAVPCLAVASDHASLLTSGWHGHRVLPDDRSPTRLARAPLTARAPPLA